MANKAEEHLNQKNYEMSEEQKALEARKRNEKDEKNEKALARINEYLRAEVVVDRFIQTVGERNAGAYISSALLAVAGSDGLKQCTPASIYLAALQAASMRLSCDPTIGQAYLVPFGGQARFVIGYKGLHDICVRTGRYRYINVEKIYEGETIERNRVSGFVSIGGHREGDKVIGWLASFQLNSKGGDYGHQLYMTVEEIHAHAKEYSPSYKNPNGAWTTHTADMERKTVLRLLLRKWGYLDPADISALSDAEDGPDIINVESIPEAYLSDEEIKARHAKPKEQILHELGQDKQ